MKNLHERLTKNLGRRLLIGVFFIFLGLIPAIYIWSTVPNHNKPPTPIPPTPVPTVVSNIQFNTNNDYLYSFKHTDKGIINKGYIKLSNNQYIYADNENEINFINSDEKITKIKAKEISEINGKFNKMNVILLRDDNNKIKFGFLKQNNIFDIVDTNKQIDINFDNSARIFLIQSSDTTFNLIYADSRSYIWVLQYDTLTNQIYNHRLMYATGYDEQVSTNLIFSQHGVILIPGAEHDVIYISWNDKIIRDNSDISIYEKVIKNSLINILKMKDLDFNYYDYTVDKSNINLFFENDNEIGVVNSQGNTVWKKEIDKNYKISYYGNFVIEYNTTNLFIKNIMYFGDLITKNYKYLIYTNSDKDIYVNFNNNEDTIYLANNSNKFLNLQKYNINTKKFDSLDFKNIYDVPLKKYINRNSIFENLNTYYFNIYENNTLKVFTKDNNIANINIDKYKITRYKNNLVILTKDKCLLLNLDRKNTTEFNLKDFDFDNSNSDFINANFDKNNILFKNVDTLSLFVFNV